MVRINKVLGVALAVASGTFLLPTVASADQISLTFKDSAITMTGEFAGFREDAYVIMTSAGELYVPASYVTCEGNDCLTFLETEESSSKS
jgi:hypothetical protein